MGWRRCMRTGAAAVGLCLIVTAFVIYLVEVLNKNSTSDLCDMSDAWKASTEKEPLPRDSWPVNVDADTYICLVCETGCNAQDRGYQNTVQTGQLVHQNGTTWRCETPNYSYGPGHYLVYTCVGEWQNASISTPSPAGLVSTAPNQTTSSISVCRDRGDADVILGSYAASGDYGTCAFNSALKTEIIQLSESTNISVLVQAELKHDGSQGGRQVV